MKVLAQVPLFTGLGPEDLASIDARLVSLSWGAGERLYWAGEPAEHLYVLAAGHAKALQPHPDGQEVVVDILAPGDLFGGLSSLGRPTLSETVEALTTVCALRIDTAAFREIVLEHPEVALHALDDVTSSLAQARTQVGEQSTSSVAQRVAATLLRLAEKFGQPRARDGGTLIQLPLSRVDLAGMTGSTPESVSRVMSRLRKDGIIDSGRRWTSVLDHDRLAATATAAAENSADN